MTDDIDNDGTTLHESGGVGLLGLPKLPHADLWVIPGDDTFDDRGFIDAMAWQEGEFSKPLFSERQLRAYGEQCAIAALAVPQAPLQAEPVPVVASEPKVWVSPEQFAAFTSDPAGDHGHYLPMRRKPAGKFTQPLYTTPQAEPAVAEQALRKAVDALEILNRRPRPMCRDCGDEDGTCPSNGLPCDMEAVIREARAALALQPAVAEQARPSREWYERKIMETEGMENFLPCGALASQSTPGTIKYCCYAAYCDAGHDRDCVNSKAQPDGGSKA